MAQWGSPLAELQLTGAGMRRCEHQTELPMGVSVPSSLQQTASNSQSAAQ